MIENRQVMITIKPINTPTTAAFPDPNTISASGSNIAIVVQAIKLYMEIEINVCLIGLLSISKPMVMPTRIALMVP